MSPSFKLFRATAGLMLLAGSAWAQVVTLPVLVRLIPQSAIAGAGDFTLTVEGAPFTRSSRVKWNGSPLRTDFDNITRLRADVPARLIASPGAAVVTVDTPPLGDSNALTFTILAPPPVISTSSLPTGTVGSPYSQTLAVTGGQAPYQWSTTTGSLPPGLSLARQSGQISGTPGSAGDFGFTVTVTDSTSRSASRALSITVRAPVAITAGALPDGTVGSAYSQTLVATGGQPPYQWSTTSGALPPGLSLAPQTGRISGTPGSAGDFPFTVTVTDSTSLSASQAFSITIRPALAIATGAVPDGTTGTPYSQMLVALGGTAPYAWSVRAGSLPPGLALSASGAVAGTPTTPGAYQPVFEVTDATGMKASRELRITILSNLAVSTAGLPDASTGKAYSHNLDASGGTPPYAWSLAAGPLPPGISLSAGGALTGTPTTPGAFSITVQVKDNVQASASRVLTLTVISGLAIATPSLPAGAAGKPYSHALSATGGTPPYTWSATGTLPPGLSLTPAGVIAGTPTAAGNFSFTVQVADGGSSSATRALSISVTPALGVVTASLPEGVPGTAYSQSLVATGGAPPYFWTLVSGSLPAGLSLDARNGTIGGTPAAAGNSGFTAQVSDAAGTTATRAFMIRIRSTLSVASPATLRGATVGAAYAEALTASGGVPPYTWAISAGALPPGLTLTAEGNVSGTPSRAGLFQFSAQVTDSTGISVSQAFSITAVAMLTVTSTSPLATGAVGSPYSQALAALGGTAPYAWSLGAGALPPGLSLDSSTGVISGTPAQVGTFNFTVQVADSVSSTVSKTFALTIASALTISTPGPLPPGILGKPYSQALAAVAGRPPYSWSITAGALPEGLALDAATGMISGTPAREASSGFTVQVSDSGSSRATRPFSIAVTRALAVVTPVLPGGTAGAGYSQKLSATGGVPPYTWAIATGSLPEGLALDEATGTVSGMPLAGGTFRFTAQVMDGSRAVAAESVVVSISLEPLPPLEVSGMPGSPGPLQQPKLTVRLQRSYALPVTGRLALSFEPDPAVARDDPAVQFSTGGRTATFTIPANTTSAVFPVPEIALQTGSVAGTITVSATVQAGGMDATPSPAPQLRAQVGRSAPVIRSLRVVKTGPGFEVWITGFSTPRELAQAVFRFAPAPGADLETSEVTVSLDEAARRWYGDTASTLFGSQFTLVQPFTVQGSTASIGSVTVVLRNADGASEPVSSAFE
jgi:hypothetical protein